MQKFLRGLLIAVLIISAVTAVCAAEDYAPLPMDDYSFGKAPKAEYYISDTEYEDPTIHMILTTGTFEKTVYNCAYVKISDVSQLRTAPAGMVDSKRSTFKSQTTARGRLVAKAVNAVVAMNGDYHTKTDKCQVVLRQSAQVRNTADGTMTLLVIDKNGNFSALEGYKKEDYAAYYQENKDDLYQVFCFGPVLVRDGECVITEEFYDGNLGSNKAAQRSAIAQIGNKEYLLVTCEGPQNNNSGLTVLQFACLCEQLGKAYSDTGCLMAFNLDGGNSSTMMAAKYVSNKLTYYKVNCPEIERFLSDIIYFATLMP